MSVRDVIQAAAGASGSAASTDPYMKNVSLLLTGDGTNGAQNNTFLDSSTNNFTITRNGNTTQGTFSPYGSLWSNYFNGTDAYLTVASNAALGMGTGDFTVECWFYYAGTPSNQFLFDFRYGGGSLLAAAVGSYGVDVYVGGGNTSGGTVVGNTWYHFAVSRASGSCKVFLNGTQIGSTFSDSTNLATGGVAIGTRYNAPTQLFPGYISNFRAVKGTALYTSNFTPSTTPLTAVSGTSLLTCQSNRFIDNSSNNFTLTVGGTPSVQRFSPFNPTAPYSAATVGGSGYFDGSGDYLTATMTGGLGSGNFTMEAWVYKVSLTNTYNSVIDFAPGLVLGYTATTVYLYYGGMLINPTVTIPLNTWFHLAAVKNSGTLTLYVNGISVGTYSDSNNYTQTGFYMGRDSSGNNAINAYISNARIVVGTAVYTSAFTPSTSPLTNITNTSLLLNFTNAGIPDAAMMNDLETVGNAQVSTSVKKYGTGSLAFDGSGDYLLSAAKPPLNFGSGNFTIEFWLYPQSASLSGEVLPLSAVDGSGNYSYASYLTSGTITSILQTSGGGQVIPSTGASLSANNWYHIAYVRNGNTYTTYVNGTGYGATTLSGSLSDISYFAIGAKYQGSFPFTGYIDDLRITKGIARYTTNFTPPAQALPTN